MNRATHAIAIKLKSGGWFAGFNDQVRTFTTSCLSKAFLFHFQKTDYPGLEETMKILRRKRHQPRRVIVGELPAEQFHYQKSIFDDL